MPSLSFVEANAREKLVDCFKSSPTEAPVLSLSTTPSRSPALKDNVNRNNTNGSSPGPLSLSLSEISPPKLNTGFVLQLPLSLSSNRETNIQTRLRGRGNLKNKRKKPQKQSRWPATNPPLALPSPNKPSKPVSSPSSAPSSSSGHRAWRLPFNSSSEEPRCSWSCFWHLLSSPASQQRQTRPLSDKGVGG